MSLKIALLGYGKMGKEVEKTAIARHHEIIARIDSLQDWNEQEPEFIQADVAIDFSMPSVVTENILKCFKLNVPVVVGTTGWQDEMDLIKKTCIDENQSLIWASNFSLGVNIFFEINKLLAKLMNNHPEYDVWMEEIHHIHKLDAPSGTAITLANDIISNISRKQKWNNTLTSQGEEIGIRSLRQDEEPGTHTVTYESDADIIEIKHTAKNRKGLATGAILAAEWLIGKKGFYSIKDFMKQ